MSVLVIAEHDNQELKGSTLNAVFAANQLGLGDIDVLVMGHECDKVAQAARTIQGVKTVRLADNVAYAHQLAENCAKLVVSMAEPYQGIIATASAMGKNLLPRVAALLDVAQLSDVIEIQAADTFVRPIYAGNALSCIKSHDRVKVLTIRPSAFPSAQQGNHQGALEIISAVFPPVSRFIRHELTQSARPSLAAAKIVISGGRGLQSAENFKMLEGIADKLGAAIGASRAAVDAGFAPNDYQVGQTGKVVAPDLYIAVGISGAIQHLAGMKDSKVIVVINKDVDAPIFQIANYGLVGDLFKILPELDAALSKK